MAKIYGGPLDGDERPWAFPRMAAYFTADMERLAVYRRQDDGTYRFEFTADESELERLRK